MTKRIEPKAKTPQSSAPHAPDLRKEFEEWHKKAHGWCPARNNNGGYSSYETTGTCRYEGFCAGYNAGYIACGMFEALKGPKIY